MRRSILVFVSVLVLLLSIIMPAWSQQAPPDSVSPMSQPAPPTSAPEKAPPTSAPEKAPPTSAPKATPPPVPPPPPHPPPPPPRAPGGKQPPRRLPLYHQMRSKIFFLGIGLSMGFFSPSDVNTHIEEWQKNLGTTISQSGFTGMFLNLVPRITVSLKPISYIKVQAIGEIGWGPKIISSNVDSKVFNFVRFSSGLVSTFHLPIGQTGKSLFTGVGFIYHWMSFEDYSANNPGFRAELGFELYTNKMMIEILAAFDYARANTKTPIGYGNTDDMILNYTGVIMGVNLHFGIF